ncbi:MAG: VanZ family protein [Arcanobacterium sp.]|nr:VanZ family protein [Arcanobacterium sp.]
MSKQIDAMITVSFIPVYLALAGVWVAFFLRAPRESRPRGTQLVAYALFGVYVGVIIFFTFTPFVFDTRTAHFELNLVPVVQSYLMVKYGILRIALYNLIGNLLLFVPLGALAPLAFSNMRSWWRVAGVLTTASLCVESLQLIFTVRLFDVDDIILNSVGGVVGYAVFAVVLARIPFVRRAVHGWDEREGWRREPRARSRRTPYGAEVRSRAGAPRVGARNPASAASNRRFPLTITGVVGFAGFIGLVIGVAFAATLATSV